MTAQQTTEAPRLLKTKSLTGREQPEEHWFDVLALRGVQVEFHPVALYVETFHHGSYSLSFDGEDWCCFENGKSIAEHDQITPGDGGLSEALKRFATCIRDELKGGA